MVELDPNTVYIKATGNEVGGWTIQNVPADAATLTLKAEDYPYSNIKNLTFSNDDLTFSTSFTTNGDLYEYLNKMLEEDTERRCTKYIHNGILDFVYYDVGKETGTEFNKADYEIMPEIINVQAVDTKNGKTVFIEFADGSKEVAVLDARDTFNLETGISICLTKKLLRKIVGGNSGSNAYNKLMDYAMSKVDAKKKAAEAERQTIKEAKQKKHIAHQEAQKKEKREREEQIKIQAEAYKRAMNEITDAIEEVKNLAK